MLCTCESAALIHIHQDGCAHVQLVVVTSDSCYISEQPFHL